jgi:hypothetical protein
MQHPNYQQENSIRVLCYSACIPRSVKYGSGYPKFGSRGSRTEPEASWAPRMRGNEVAINANGRELTKKPIKLHALSQLFDWD